MIQIKKTILTLVALIAVTTGAWAEESETINTATDGTTVYTGTHFKITASYGCDDDGIILRSMYTSGTATIEALNGENITKIEMHMKKGGWLSTSTTTTAGKLVATNSDIEENDISVTDINATSVTIGTSHDDEDWIQINKFVIYFAPASGPKVDWDKDKKTGQFTMPGGNVELEPEYYPQAALTAAPSAINDVPATTDGAIVKAGTVANIGETTTAQGTVMYYAVQSATAPTAPDYDATGWTDKVPTATDFDEGNVYVWYYVKGADGDETSTFNDGDITKLGESGYITLLAAPTYAVTFADDTAEPDKWTASPNTDVTKGQTVTVTYTGTKKVLGVKAEKKAAAPAGPVTYTELKGGEVLHVGDKIQVPETDKYWYPGGNALDYRYTYEVVRVNISGSLFETTATESETGAYYALHKVGSNDYLFATATFDDSSRLPATATSDGIAVADNGFTNGYHKYIFSVHEP